MTRCRMIGSALSATCAGRSLPAISSISAFNFQSRAQLEDRFRSSRADGHLFSQCADRLQQFGDGYIAPERLRPEMSNALFTRFVGHELSEEGPDSASLPIISDHHGNIGRSRIIGVANPSANSHQGALRFGRELGDKSQMIPAVATGQPAKLIGSKSFFEKEKAGKACGRRKLVDAGDELRGVGWSDRPES